LPSINQLVATKVLQLRHEHLKNITRREPKLWSEITEENEYTIITMVIPTRGCSWALSEYGGCSVCGYINDSSRDLSIPIPTILSEIETLLKKIETKKRIILKIFNSGSFFDESDVPRNLRENITKLIQKYPHCSQLSVESRSEYVINYSNIIEKTKKAIDPTILEVGIGLESSNNSILRDCWNKGMRVSDYDQAVDVLKNIGVKIKTYIFIKPPFLTEYEALIDSISTINHAVSQGTDSISINPCSVQNGTLAHYLYKKDRYQPPWLWSILFIVSNTKKKYPQIKLICEPTAGGKPRGTHNCGECDIKVLGYIKDIIDNQPIPSDYSKICSCAVRWYTLITSPIELFRTTKLSKLG